MIHKIHVSLRASVDQPGKYYYAACTLHRKKLVCFLQTALA